MDKRIQIETFSKRLFSLFQRLKSTKNNKQRNERKVIERFNGLA